MKIPQLRIHENGTIAEWNHSCEETEKGHRHISHLFALHPGTQIDPRNNLVIAKAAENTLYRRLVHGGGHTGWSCAWIVNFFARLYKGEKAHEYLHGLLKNSTYPNMFDAHPPFQIDGNFGGTAGIVEMLLQSHLGRIELLPSLPNAWSTGFIKGLRARGGFIVSMWWREGRLYKSIIKSECGETCTIVISPNITVASIKVINEPAEQKEIQISSEIKFITKKGSSYELLFVNK